MSSSTPTRTTTVGRHPTPPGRARWLVALGLTTALLLLGAAALVSVLRRDHSNAAAVGRSFDIDHGQMVVDSMTDVNDPMAGMQAMQNASAFGASGMPMAGMTPDPVPEGMRRVRVDIRIRAEDLAVEYPSNRFKLGADGSLPVSPRRSLSGDAVVAAGMSASASFEFDVPASWAHFVLTYTDGTTHRVNSGVHSDGTTHAH